MKYFKVGEVVQVDLNHHYLMNESFMVKGEITYAFLSGNFYEVKLLQEFDMSPREGVILHSREDLSEWNKD